MSNRAILSRIHRILSETGGIRLANCKSRARTVDDFLVGEGQDEGAFVHLDVRFLQGRPDAVRTALGVEILQFLKQAAADPDVVAAARRDGIPADWLDAARRSPVYALAKEYRVALPLHPEYRTAAMMFYIPPLSPVMSTIERNLVRLDVGTDEHDFELFDQLGHCCRRLEDKLDHRRRPNQGAIDQPVEEILYRPAVLADALGADHAAAAFQCMKRAAHDSQSLAIAAAAP